VSARVLGNPRNVVSLAGMKLKAAVAIGTFDKARRTHLQIDPGMAQGTAHAFTGQSVGMDPDNLGHRACGGKNGLGLGGGLASHDESLRRLALGAARARV